jgi:hypothetical protein
MSVRRQPSPFGLEPVSPWEHVDVDGQVAFDYRLVPNIVGWSESHLLIGAASARLTASDIGDALGDIVRAALALARGVDEVRVVWANEPGEYRWVLTRSRQVLSVRLLWFDDGPWSRKPDDRGREVLAATCEVQMFCAAVAQGAARVRGEHGVAGYRKHWDFSDFPSQDLDALLALT